jgi:hypothetical protein
MQDIPDGMAAAGRRRGRRAPAAGGRADEAAGGLSPGVARQRAAALHHVGADPAARLHVRFHRPLMPVFCRRPDHKMRLPKRAPYAAEVFALLSHGWQSIGVLDVHRSRGHVVPCSTAFMRSHGVLRC